MPRAIWATSAFLRSRIQWISAPGSKSILAHIGIHSMRGTIAGALAAFLLDVGATQAMSPSPWCSASMLSNTFGLLPKRSSPQKSRARKIDEAKLRQGSDAVVQADFFDDLAVHDFEHGGPGKSHLPPGCSRQRTA